MAQPRPEELTLPNRIVDVVETSIVDFIQVNSGTCTGNFSINKISSNVLNNTTNITTDHLMANSGTLTGKVISSAVQANSGLFLTSLTVSGLPVRIDSLGAGAGITALVQDANPILGGNLNGNSNNISGVNALTANTGNFPISTTTATINANNASIALNSTADHFIGNSGTLNGKLIADITQSATGTFTSSLTISGLPVSVNEDVLRILFTDGAGTTWTNMPAAVTFFNGGAGVVQQVDLSKKTQVRISHTKGATAGAANSRLFLRYSPSFSSTASAYTAMVTNGTFATPTVQVNTTNSFLQTGWETILPAARNVVFLAVVGSGGDGALDPVFGSTVAEFR